jgi:hypothetical protein
MQSHRHDPEERRIGKPCRMARDFTENSSSKSSHRCQAREGANPLPAELRVHFQRPQPWFFSASYTSPPPLARNDHRTHCGRRSLRLVYERLSIVVYAWTRSPLIFSSAAGHGNCGLCQLRKLPNFAAQALESPWFTWISQHSRSRRPRPGFHSVASTLCDQLISPCQIRPSPFMLPKCTFEPSKLTL